MPHQGVSELVDFEGNGLSRFGCGQDAITVRFAVHLEPEGQADDDIFPSNRSAAVFLEPSHAVAVR